MINDKNKVIMSRIPKSAGQSMEIALNGELTYGWDEEHHIWRQHATMQEIRDLYATPEQFQNYFKFAFVRNPWDRLVSSFYFWKFPSNLPEQHHKEAFTAFLKKEGPFAEGQYADICDSKYYHVKSNIYHHLRPQYQYIADDQGKVLTDFIGKFENITDDWQRITETLGISVQLPVKNKGRHRDYKEYYTRETKKLVENQYQADIDTFKYTFGK